MNKSTKKKFNTDMQYLKFIKKTGDGSKQYMEPISIKVLTFDKETIIMTNQGENAVSNIIVYIDPADISNVLDEDTVIYKGVRKQFKKVNSYKNTKGFVELWEIYI